MAYTATDKILADHYNTFVAGAGTFGISNDAIANINTVWGVGFADKGYGQSSPLNQVPIGTIVSATQWATLIDNILTVGDHQGTALGNMPGDGGGGGPAITGGDLIEAITTMQSNVTDVFDNRLIASATGLTSVEAAAGSSNWSATSVHVINVQFTSVDAARYFFNAGGNIAITGTMTPTGAKVDIWDDSLGDGILPESGIVRFNAQSTTKEFGADGDGTLNVDYFIEAGTGYYGIQAAPIEIFKQFTIGGGAYPTNHWTIEVQTNATSGDNGANGDLITFTVTLFDDVGAGDPVIGTTTVTATVNFPDTTFLPDAPWSTVTFDPASSVVQT